MIKIGNKEVEGRYITDDNGVPHEVVAAYVGNNLVYNAKVEEENAEFYKRKTGGTQSVGSGIAAIKEVRGKSIVWNQIVENGDFSDQEKPFKNWNLWGGSREIVNNEAVFTNINYMYYINQNPLVVGHKYFITVRMKYTGTGSPRYTIDWIKSCTYVEIPKDNYQDIKIIATATGTGTNQYYGLLRLSNGHNSVIYIDRNAGFKVIDLTLMFGAGNEPATVAEFEKMFPLDYYNYNAGEVISFAAQNLVTTGKNQYNPATGKANLLGGQTYQLLGTYTSATIDEEAVTLDSNNCFTTTKDCVLDVTGGNDTDTIVALYNGENITFEPYEKHTQPLDPSQWRDKNGNLVFPYGGMHGAGTAYDYAKVDADGYIRKVMRVYERRAYESGDVTSGNIITDRRTYTFYPLAEPIEVELSTPVYAKYLVDKDGTEEITPANGSTPYTTMANLHLVYRKK